MAASWRIAAAIVVILAILPAVPGAAGEYTVRGMVLRVDAAGGSFVVSHERIHGLMDSMTMPFEVREGKELEGVEPGAIVEFTLVVHDAGAYATGIRIRRYESVEPDPRAARRLGLLSRLFRDRPVRPIAIGQPVPDFTLIDQAGQSLALSSLAGKVVAVNFIYTRCALPQFCLRVTNDFSVLKQRFQAHLGRDLVLLTITFDPARDRPGVLADYASRWSADRGTWRFLTGSVAGVRRVCEMFGVDAFSDEGLVSHSLRTAVVDREGRLAASIEGNAHTPEQLGDLVLAVINR